MTTERGEGGIPPDEIEAGSLETEASAEVDIDIRKTPETLPEALKIIEVLRMQLERAKHDPLTDLRRRDGVKEWFQHLFAVPTKMETDRRHAEEHVGERREISAPAFMTVLVLDIDKFTSINTRYGHPGGDAALEQVGAFLRGIFRETDCLIRWGGEEIVILLPDVTTGAMMNKFSYEQIPWQTRRDAREAGTPITSKANEHPQLYFTAKIPTVNGEEAEELIKFSGGIITIDTPPEIMQDLDKSGTPKAILHAIDKADRALYAAKQEGRNQIFPVEDHEH
jgi:diguanylate cyclase (GGDEF)-like protein